MTRPFLIPKIAPLMALLLASSMALADDSPLFRGTILAVGDTQITVMQGKDSRTYVVASDTKISLDGEPVKLKDLKPGHAAKVASKEENGRLVATSIEVRGMIERRIEERPVGR